MLSALPATQHAPPTLYNGSSCALDLPSPHVPGTPLFSSSAMSGKSLPSFASSSARPPSARTPPYVTSPGQMFRILGYTPQEGPAGTTIWVSVQFSLIRAETTFLRIVVGNRALSTTVRASKSEQENEWELEAVVPELEMVSSDLHSSSSTVPLTVQALNHSNVALDTLTFGKFTYTRRCASSSPPLRCKQEVSDRLGFGPPSTPGTPDMKSAHASPHRCHAELTRKGSRPTPASGTARARALNATMAAKDAQSARGQLKKQSLIRARRSSTDGDDGRNNLRAVLQVETPTEPMAVVDDWDEEERRTGRRLVRFTRVQDGCTLHVACEAIQPSEYTDGDTVVSCICRPPEAVGPGESPASQCCITSVDIIFLLECLVGDIFNIEEKNRIRRNLEGFRPKTVSKNKVGTEEFFQKIMDFPAPKPRNIEKDVKVFDWAVLPQALDKIIAKYTLSSGQKREDCTTSPIPQPSSVPSTLPRSCIATPYTTSSTPEHTPSTSPQQPYFHNQAAYHSPQYVPGSLDLLDNNYVAATALSSAGSYHSLLSHSHPHSDTSSPAPTLRTGGVSPMASNPVSIPYIDSPHALYQTPYSGQGAYGSGSVYVPSYDSPDYQRMAMASSPHGSQSFL
ncbi:hypothetical protein V8D89_015416 [Ganoderma adspersum]